MHRPITPESRRARKYPVEAIEHLFLDAIGPKASPAIPIRRPHDFCSRKRKFPSKFAQASNNLHRGLGVPCLGKNCSRRHSQNTLPKASFRQPIPIVLLPTDDSHPFFTPRLTRRIRNPGSGGSIRPSWSACGMSFLRQMPFRLNEDGSFLRRKPQPSDGIAPDVV